MNRFEIRVIGHLDERRARALGADLCRRTPHGESVLTVSAFDSAATYGLLARLRDAGLELLSVTPIGDGDEVRRDAVSVERDA